MHILRILLLLLVHFSTSAQVITELDRWYIFPGAAAQRDVPIAPFDSTKTPTAVLYTSPTGSSLVAWQQPIVTKVTPTTVRLRLPVTTGYPQLSYAKISLGGRLTYGIVVDINTKNVNVTPPGSQTIQYPVSDPQNVQGGAASNVPTEEFYTVPGAHTGQIITHGKGTRFVKAESYRVSNGQNTEQVDLLWSQITIINDNQVMLNGPPGETPNLTVKLTFSKRPTQ